MMYPVDFLQSEEDSSYHISKTESNNLNIGSESHCSKCNQIESPDHLGSAVNCVNCTRQLRTSTRSTTVEVTAENVMKKSIYGESRSENHLMGQMFCLQCPKCQGIAAMQVQNHWWPINDLLTSSKDNRNGLQKVNTFGERLVLYVLSQIVYQQHKNEHTAFLPPGRKEVANVMWKNGVAAGFYTLKPKGSVYSALQCDTYLLPVVDLIFVQPAFRRQGIATQMVEEIVRNHPGQNIGFSHPVSADMLKVLRKYLTGNPSARDFIWETTWTGAQGQRQNIWLTLKCHHSKRKRQNTPEKETDSKELTGKSKTQRI